MKTLALSLCALLLSATSAQAGEKEDLEELMATFINLNGYLCAKVVDVKPLKLKDTYEVTCFQYRGGSAKATYVFGIRESGILVEKI